ncbi:MAG TPA: radical SAM protein [Syntrophorhabdaceae bacterium]|nr:radical SAM protein [Syntrophorhabdaceae bacterium]HNT67712.1 radical SAM protein [Syntrophorhabdaceae bacterium]
MRPVNRRFQYIYGPVPSWRIGSSLGIDLLSQTEKICSFDCTYCQLGKTKNYSLSREKYVDAEEVMKELATLPQDVQIDYLTFSGRGEPTLAANLGDAITAARRTRREPIAVITNSSIIDREDVRQELALADYVIAKLDAPIQGVFEVINRPGGTIRFQGVLDGIKKFRKGYKGKLALQLMFTKENEGYAGELARIVRDIGPDEVQLNTPLRQSPVQPLPEEGLSVIQELFNGLPVISVYRSHKISVKPLSDPDTLIRRGKT